MRELWSVLVAMAAARMLADAVIAAWPELLYAGLAGGACFALLGWVTLRA